MTLHLPQTTLLLPDQSVLDSMLDKTRGRLFYKKGAAWFGSLLCSHTLIWDDECDTAWCNGTTIGFSRKFFFELINETRVTLLAHELAHTMYDHMGRLLGRDPELWNVAADYVINNELDHMGFSFTNMNPLLDHQYDNMSTEQVYERLQENGYQPPPMMALICPQIGKVGDEPDPNTGNGPAIPSLCGDLRQPLPGSHAQIMSTIIKAVQAAQMSKDPGSLPGEAKQIMDKFLDPVLPWDTLLFRYFSERSNDDYSYKRPNRRHVDEYLPSLISDNGLEHLIYYFDVSGSVTDPQEIRFFSEVRYIHSVLRPARLTIVQFDDEIQKVDEFYLDDPFVEIEIIGRGGTNLEPVYDHIVANNPTAAVIFTDLHCRKMQLDPGVPVLWIVMENPHAKVNFGTMIHLTKADLA